MNDVILCSPYPVLTEVTVEKQVLISSTPYPVIADVHTENQIILVGAVTTTGGDLAWSTKTGAFIAEPQQGYITSGTFNITLGNFGSGQRTFIQGSSGIWTLALDGTTVWLDNSDYSTSITAQFAKSYIELLRLPDGSFSVLRSSGITIL